jgi:uncharacterized protein YeaO (DUF488 family)
MVMHVASLHPRATLLARTEGQQRILITREWAPQFQQGTEIDLWVPDAAPSRQLWRAWRGGHLPWEAFAQQYTDYVQAVGYFRLYHYMTTGPFSQLSGYKPEPLIAVLAAMAAQRECVFLSHEQGPDTTQTYRQLLQTLVTGYDGPELQRFLAPRARRVRNLRGRQGTGHEPGPAIC